MLLSVFKLIQSVIKIGYLEIILKRGEEGKMETSLR
jgi:hypothetical protein